MRMMLRGVRQRNCCAALARPAAEVCRGPGNRHVAEPLEPRRLLAANPAGPEFRVNSVTASDQFQPSVAADAEGNFVVAWRSFGQDGSGSGVYARRYSAAGDAVGEEFRVNTFTTGIQSDPSVAVEPDGDFVIAWESLHQEGSSSSYEVYAQRYTAAGDPVGGEFRVNATTEDALLDPEVAVDADGDFVVTWVSE